MLALVLAAMLHLDGTPLVEEAVGRRSDDANLEARAAGHQAPPAPSEPPNGSPDQRPPLTPEAIPAKSVSHPNIHFLDRSEFFWAPGLILEAQPAPHFFIYDNSDSESFRRLPAAGRANWALSAVATPLFRIRILNKPSNPIKTLSFMPKATVRLFRLQAKSGDAEEWTGARLWVFQATYGHHSNGQDECLYQAGVAEGDPGCRPDDPRSLAINYPNGSFSTNYLQVGLYHKWFEMAENIRRQPFRRPHRTVALGASLEVQSKLGPGGALDPGLSSVYGRNRVQALVEYEQRVTIGWLPRGLSAGSVRATLRPEYIAKQSRSGMVAITGGTENRGAPRFRLGAELSWNPDSLRGWGPMVRYDYGQDYYNLELLKKLNRLAVGFVFDQSEFDRFINRERQH